MDGMGCGPVILDRVGGTTIRLVRMSGGVVRLVTALRLGLLVVGTRQNPFVNSDRNA